MRRHAIAAALLLLIASASPSAAQTGKLVESIEVRVTNVDVVVTDRNGNAVRGLTKDDFEVLENGHPQEITNFYEVRPENVQAETKADPGAPPTATAPLPPPERRRRRFIFFVDNYSLHPFRRNEVFTALRTFLTRNVAPGDEAMLVSWYHAPQVVVPYTSDVHELERGLMQLERGNGGGMGLEFDREATKAHIREIIAAAQARSQGRLQALQEAFEVAMSFARAYANNQLALERSLLESLRVMVGSAAGVEGRKVLVFAGAHLPEKPGIDLFQWMKNTFQQVAAELNPVAESSNRSVLPLLESIGRSANAAGVTMYTLDVADMGVSGADAREELGLDEEMLRFTNSAQAYQTLANLTGGVALANTRNYDLAFQTIARDLESYYSLGYRPGGDTGADRNIVVKVKRPDLRARSRRTYVVKSGEQLMDDRVLANLLQTGVKSEMTVRVAAGTPKRDTRNTFRVPVAVQVPSSLTLLPQGDKLVGGYTVYIAAGGKDGSVSQVNRIPQQISIAPSDEAQFRRGVMFYKTTLLLRQGEQIVSVGVNDDISNAAGFARTSLVVQAKE
jgi:VWFA-related protein